MSAAAVAPAAATTATTTVVPKPVPVAAPSRLMAGRSAPASSSTTTVAPLPAAAATAVAPAAIAPKPVAAAAAAATETRLDTTLQPVNPWAHIRSGYEQDVKEKPAKPYEPTEDDIAAHLALKLPMSRTVSEVFLDISTMNSRPKPGALEACRRFMLMLRQWAQNIDDPADDSLGWECHRQLMQLAHRWCRVPYRETDDFKNGAPGFKRVVFDEMIKLERNAQRRRVRERPGPHDMPSKAVKGDEYHVHDFLDAWGQWDAHAEICQVADDIGQLKYLRTIPDLHEWLKETAGRWSENMNFIRFPDDEPKGAEEEEEPAAATAEAGTQPIPCTPSPKKRKRKSKSKSKGDDPPEETKTTPPPKSKADDSTRTPPQAPKKKLKPMATPPPAAPTLSPMKSPVVTAAAAAVTEVASTGGSPVKKKRAPRIADDDD